MENRIINLESNIEKLTERITILENLLSKCENCKNVKMLYTCDVCDKKICDDCSSKIETKSYTKDFCIIYKCFDCMQ